MLFEAESLDCAGGGGGGGCGGGLYGVPPMVDQAPGNIELVQPKSASTGVPVGFKVVSFPLPGPARQLGTNPVTGKPTYPAPGSASGSVGVSVKQEIYDPGPTPPVGFIAPCACAPAPQKTSSWGGLVIFAVVILGLWFAAGASLRRFL
jgi:hypothetical protein